MIDYDWKCPAQRKAEKKAMRRLALRSFWQGFTEMLGAHGNPYDDSLFWKDVVRFGGREPK